MAFHQLSSCQVRRGNVFSFWLDCFDLIAFKGTFNSLLQHHSSEASILWCSAFFIAHISYLYITTGKTISFHYTDLCWQSDVSRLVIAFLPRSKHLLILWLQSPSAVILEPPKIKSLTVSTVSPSICHEVMGPDAMMLVFWVLSFKPTFSLSSFTFIKRLFSSSLLSAIGWCLSRQSWFHLVLHPAQRFSWCTLHVS